MSVSYRQEISLVSQTKLDIRDDMLTQISDLSQNIFWNRLAPQTFQNVKHSLISLIIFYQIIRIYVCMYVYMYVFIGLLTILFNPLKMHLAQAGVAQLIGALAHN